MVGLNVAVRMEAFRGSNHRISAFLNPPHPLRCYVGFGDKQVPLSVMNGDPHPPLTQPNAVRIHTRARAHAPVMMQTDISMYGLKRTFLHFAGWF